MFLKPFKVRLSHQLNKTDRKVLKEQCTKSFPLITDPTFSNDFITKKDAVTLCKITTSNNQPIDVYVVNQVPLLFSYDGQLFPTVYFLWQFPNCLLYFTTHSGVVDKLKGGADLMLPGVVYPKFNLDVLDAMSMFERNTRVYVNVTTNKAAMAVGVTTESTTVLNTLRNRGKCVIIYHCIDDYLCKINNTRPLPLPELGIPIAFLSLSSEILQSNLEPEHNSATQEALPIADDTAEKKAMDDLMLRCLLVAMKYATDLKAPILLSTFCNTYMKRACPSIDIAKSSYGKLTPFMTKCVEDGLIELKQEGSVYSISKFNKQHPMVQSFQYSEEEGPIIMMEASKRTITITKIRYVTQPVSPLFAAFGLRSGDTVPEAEIHNLLEQYIHHENLVYEENDARFVRVTDVLKSVIPTRENTISWKLFEDKVLQRMTKGYIISNGESEYMRKGELSPITILTATRSNKCVTLVNNVELYFIHALELAKDCQLTKATGAKINETSGSSSKQLQLQGNMVKFVTQLLKSKYGIPEDYIVSPDVKKK